MLLVMTLLSACASVGTSGTINLCNKLPTVSEKDTDQTIIEVDNFNAQYRALYGCK
jgi:hypothetical protein